MNAVNAVQLLLLVWTFYAVCQADDDYIVYCDDVTGSVGKEVTFTCRVSLRHTDCCIQMYKFHHPNHNNDSSICKEEFPVNSCEQSNIFTCRYTPTTAMTEQFRIFVQTKCRVNITEFTVNISVVCCFILIIIIIIMAIIRNNEPNINTTCGFQKRIFPGLRHDEDSSDHPEDVIIATV